MRRLFRGRDSGVTDEALEWGARTGRWRRVRNGIYADGPEPPTRLDRERAHVMASSSPARGGLAGVLYGLDSVALDGQPIRRGRLISDVIVEIEGVRCAGAVQTLVDLAADLDDDTWEQMLGPRFESGS